MKSFKIKYINVAETKIREFDVVGIVVLINRWDRCINICEEYVENNYNFEMIITISFF